MAIHGDTIVDKSLDNKLLPYYCSTQLQNNPSSISFFKKSAYSRSSYQMLLVDIDLR